MAHASTNKLAAIRKEPNIQECFVIPPYSREGDIEEVYDPQQRKAESGFGRSQGARRGL
jgi:hypothetical protein